MTPRQVTLVQSSFEKVVPIAEVAAELFYTRLFEIEPSLKGLFHGDMADQGRKLMTAMSMVVNGLDKLERILPMVQELDRRHVDYGALPRHYAIVGEALLWTLEQGLGDAFNDETRAAWATAYGLLSGALQEAAEKQAA